MKLKLIFWGCFFCISACNPYQVPMVPSSQYIPVIQVEKDDTLYSLAKKYSISVDELARKNNIDDPTTLKAGQTLAVHGIRSATTPVTTASGEGSSVKKTTPTRSATKQTTTTGASKTAHSVSTKTTPAPKAKKLDKPFVATGKVNFVWPVKGNILSSYGNKGHGIKNDGINIGASKGTRVNAAEAGIVVYAGNELKGYGNLVLIRHEKEFMTAYAHLNTILVTTGDVVSRGEKIGTVGATGNVQSPQLHFEIRKKTKAVNPKSYLQ